MLQKYSFQESLSRIWRSITGKTIESDQPEIYNDTPWNIVLSNLAELFQDSYPGVTGTFPQHFQISSGSFAHAHELMHLYGIGEQRLGRYDSNVHINGNGYLTLDGDASVWTDFSVPLTRTQQGANNLPHFDTTNIGLLFPQNDVTEKVYFTVQFPHNKKLNSEIHPHVHYVQSVTGTPIFMYTYRWYNLDDNVPTVWVTGSTTAGTRNVFTYVSGSMSQLSTFPDVNWDKPWDEKYSSTLDIILWRNDNVVTGDVLVKYIDIHYQIDSLGSDNVYT